MEDKVFEKQIERELQKMSKKQVVFFAWLCAVRALPFIGTKGNFNYWKKEVRQKHLYALFNALDVNYYYYVGAVGVAARDAAYAAARAAIDADAAADAAAYAADAAADAARAATDADAAAIAATDAYVAAIVAVRAARDAAYDAYARADADMQNILLEDIQKEHTNLKNHLELYGEIWDNFLQALDNEDCSYWGRLYKDIFENSFKMDTEALKRRMNVPKEIQEQGAARVALYLKDLEEQGAKHLNEARVIILGEKGAGKTCLARRLINPSAPMTNDEESTAGVDTTLWKPEQDDMNVHIWDFAGHVVTHAVHRFFLSERCLYILVYDGRTEERNRVEYWLDHIKNYGGDSEVFILLNKRDTYIPEIHINSLREKYPIAGFYTFSIYTDRDELEKFRKEVAGYIKSNPSWSKQEIPANYFNVKKELEQRFAENKNEYIKKDEYIKVDEFEQIAKRNEVDDFEGLLRSLHALGICLRYESMEDFDTLVLNPEWISNGVYKIINWVHEQGKHLIFLTDFPTVFKNDAARYPQDKHPFLFALMKRYELAFETEKENCLIIPHLLHEDRPKILPEFSVGESLMLRYKAEQPLPPDTISRFIVRHNVEIKKQENEFLVWRYGVVLEDEKGSIALVREWKEKRMIEVSVKGKDKTTYLDKLRETLSNIFNSYKSNKPELQYRIERFGLISDFIEKDNPLWLQDSKIYSHHHHNRPYYDDYSNRDIPMQHVVQIYKITAENLIMGTQGYIIDKSVRNTFNFYNCNIELQGHLNDLAGSLKLKGKTEEAESLEDAANVLSEVEQCKTPEEVKKKGIINKLKRIVDELNDENSKLHKTVKGIKHGISIAQDIAKGYNEIAQWCGLPQVPKLFLGKE